MPNSSDLTLANSIAAASTPTRVVPAWTPGGPGAGDPRTAILAGLTAEQAAAATQDGAVLVLAGAGTGKSRTLVTAAAWRIGVLGIPAHRVLAVTFTNKAAREMLDRLRVMLAGQAVPTWAGTFHGLGARMLRADPEIAGLRHGFEILDADDSKRIIKRLLRAMHGAVTDGHSDEDEDTLAQVKSVSAIIGRFKDNLVTADAAAARVEALVARASQAHRPVNVTELRLAARVYPEYQRRLREANAADFGDLLLHPTITMRDNEAYRRRWASKFDVLLADEYQDICLAQYWWLRLLAQDHGRFFAVGDDSQSIYGWRGADIGYIRQFTRDFPGAATLPLSENFRSTRHILDCANAVIAKDPARLGTDLRTRQGAGAKVEVVLFGNAEAEATGLVAEMRRRHAQHGVPWQDMALLYRMNALSRPIEEALMRARVPYVLVGDVAFYQRAEIKDAIALLRLAASPDDRQSDEAFRRMCNVPKRGFGAKAQVAVEDEAARRVCSLLAACATAALSGKAQAGIAAFAQAVRAVAGDRTATVADQISLLLERTGYSAKLRDSRAETTEDRTANLHELQLLAGAFHSVRELLDHAALAASAPGEDEDGRVHLMSLHRGKGLEYPHVFLPAWETGVFPATNGDVAEERRLAYVALTRGKVRVTISYCEFRRGYPQPSPFLADLPEGSHVRGWLDAPQTRAQRPPAARGLPDGFEDRALLGLG